MIQGFLRISRNIVDWDWYTDANTFRVFMHLLLTANYKDCNYKGVEVKRGQVATSRKEIAKALRMSEQNVRTSLSHLKSTNEITSKSTNKLTIITLCKYDSWQDLTSETNQQTNRKLTINQPTIEEESNKYNNNNKEKEDTKVSPKKKIDYQAVFDCWNKYNGKKIRKVTQFTDARKKAIKKMLDIHNISQEVLMRFFASIPFADQWLFHPTGTHKLWKPTFDWWMANTNGWLTKGLEGGVHLENPQAFERIMKAGTFSSPSVMYLPQGRSIWFDESTKAYWTDDNFYYGVISDGYTDEDRPDGATLTMSNARGIITWNSSTKKWEKK